MPGSQGETIADNFVHFNGGDPGQLGRHSWTGSLQSVVRARLSEELNIIAAAEFTVAPPGPGETYRAFLNALGGGVELGNPQLKDEEKKSVALGVQHQNNNNILAVQLWMADMANYVSRVRIVEQPLVYSFRNIGYVKRAGQVRLFVIHFR